jgi:hypothetical protein
MGESTERLTAIQQIVEGIKKTYSDATKVQIEIEFEWIETAFYDDGAELCPRVKINIER